MKLEDNVAQKLRAIKGSQTWNELMKHLLTLTDKPAVQPAACPPIQTSQPAVQPPVLDHGFTDYQEPVKATIKGQTKTVKVGRSKRIEDMITADDRLE